MKTFTRKLTVVGMIGAAALMLGGPAQAALQDRDLDGNGQVDAFYDTDLDITWLRDANVNGGMDWLAALAWADGYSIGGHADWRLPTSDACANYNCTSSEMGHLWYVELGNSGGAMTNTGSFQNLLPDYYWSGTDAGAVNPNYAWTFRTSDGAQSDQFKGLPLLAMAVTNGDVGMVPEPGTYALMLAGLAGVVLARKRRSSVR